MKRQNITLFILFFFLLFSCTSKTTKQTPVLALEDSAAIVEEPEIPLPELEEGEVYYKNKDPFNGVVDLTGTQMVADTVIFKLGETEMLIKDNRLIMKNINAPIRVFQLPDLKFIGERGTVGNGPNEFLAYSLILSCDDDVLSYVYNKGYIYKITTDDELVFNRYKFTDKIKQFDEKQMAETKKDNFVYIENSKTGKSIFHVNFENDTAVHKEILSLALTSRMKSWVPYIGDFVVNPQRNRMAYAYKYFKIIKFMDLEAKTIRTINFEKEKFDEGTLYKLDGMDQNTTHYWGACAGKDYVYFLYSGRTPSDVWKEGQKGLHYIFVEQYDWNGNPIKKYKLDQWGRFTVDEKDQKIYLASTNHDDPFFIYNLPVIH
ncbi:BF3164 family lipoprotein [Massilibacteroides sp.]|uniref:BF3164 family lipoprotein n=1 Tax=Massilibacteroides sp. TaxID=2034766 RepID=UPI002615F4B6|nr:BF3164 family lipoprotein [Massilibacteroides sp.]MDD4514056.1 BF3164 family lipoprotein [Massilibacteroides sp.]